MSEPQSQIKTIGMSYNGHPVTLDQIEEKQNKLDLPNPVKVTEVDPRKTLDYIPPKPKNYELDLEAQVQPDGVREVDYQDLLQVNFEIISLVKRMHDVRNELRKTERAVVKCRIAYDQSLRREVLKISGATEKTRQAWAEIQCEDLYQELQVAQQIFRELQQFSKDVRTELDALKEISNNLRRQVDIDTRR